MEETYLLNYPGVKKKILSGGTGPMPHFPPGAKIAFHFQTLLDNFERTVIDDSRLAKRPAEIFMGKMFKMEVWETLLTSMRVGEVAEFWCDAIHTGLYPIVSKGMRLIALGKDPLEGQRHMCGMGNMFNYHSTGWPELDEIMRTPQPLIFIMELVQVGDPMSYKRESWMMEKDEKLQEVPILHMQGNALVKQGRFEEAASRYKEAVLLLKTVQSREMPGDIDYINLGRMIVPLELNYCQCMMELKEYYDVIEHTTELLEKNKDCVKAYYKRAKAYAAVWSEKEARRDYNMVASLDATLSGLVCRELKVLSDSMKEKYWEEKEAYWNKLEGKKIGEEAEEEEEEEEAAKNEDKEEKEKKQSNTKCEDESEFSADKGRIDQEEAAEIKMSETAANYVEADGAQTQLKTEKRETEKRETEKSAPDKTEGKDWQQMLRLVMFLQDEGTFLMKEHRYEEASTKFKEAIEYVDFLQYKEVEHKGEDWVSLEKVRLPVTLNLSQCMLELREYQQVVELNNKLLKAHTCNFKAVYQRARAHSALCNEDEARRDFQKAEHLDPKFKAVCRQELKKLGENIRSLHGREKKTYSDVIQERWGPGGLKTKASTVKAKKTVQFAQRDGDTATKLPATAERKGTFDAVGGEESKNEKGCRGASGERVESGEKAESAVFLGDRQAMPDNQGGDEDSGPAPASTGKDKAENTRSGSCKGTKKIKCQSTPTQGQGQGRTGRNKSTNDGSGNGGTDSESANRCQLFAADPKAAGEAEDGERLAKQADRPNTEQGELGHVHAGSDAQVKGSDKDAAKPLFTTGNINSAASKTKRKPKKKK